MEHHRPWYFPLTTHSSQNIEDYIYIQDFKNSSGRKPLRLVVILNTPRYTVPAYNNNNNNNSLYKCLEGFGGIFS
jgi:hypothetical protein